MPTYSHSLDVDASPDAVYAIIDDTDRTPEWLDRCTRIDNLEDGPNRVGTPLRYHYRDGRRTGTMDGRIVTHDAGRRFAMTFADKMMDVTVDFRTDPAAGGGTRLTHDIDIRTRGVGKLFTPLIKRSLPKQTVSAMENLKALAERG
jgi:hypothetical protein